MLLNGNEIACVFFFAALGVAGATILVEKRDQQPISCISKAIAWTMRKLFLGFAVGLLECTVCCSFWMAGILELAWWLRSGMPSWSLTWPFSGIVAMAISFYLIDFLNTLERRQ
jgi:hypothetical protein